MRRGRGTTRARHHHRPKLGHHAGAPAAVDDAEDELDVIAEAEPDEGPAAEVRDGLRGRGDGGPHVGWDFGDGQTRTDKIRRTLRKAASTRRRSL